MPNPVFTGHFDATYADHAAPGVERREEMVDIVDGHGFSVRLLFVGATGYLASSYCLFVQNVIKPALYYVYTPCGRLSGNAGLVLDELTLVGSVIGMIVAGHLADLWGRKKLYGWELLTLIVATIGTAQASEGFRSQLEDGTYGYSTDIYSWLAWWRFVLGLAIGAEHPLVTIITAEWAATQWRGIMLTLVFSMLPFARLLAYGIGLAALRVSSANNGLSPDLRLEDDSNLLTKHVADQVWRWAIGVAVIPAALAVAFRFAIPETPRFYAHIRKNLTKAMRIAREFNRGEPTPGTNPSNAAPPSSSNSGASTDGESIPDREMGRRSRWPDWLVRWTDWLAGANAYLKEGSVQTYQNTSQSNSAGRHLIVISTLCFISEIGWYCLATDSNSSMSTFFHDPSTTTTGSTSGSISARANLPVNYSSDSKCPEFNAWNSDKPTTIYQVLATNSTRFMLVSSLGSILGSMTLVFLINRFHRKHILQFSFAVLAILNIVVGAILVATYDPNADDLHPSADVFFGIMHFFYAFGPRTVIYILAAEIFPTEYRGTFYGVTAAVGKLAAVAIRPVIGRTSKLPRSLGIRLMVVAPFLLFAVWLCRWLPLVQGESDDESLEDEKSGGKLERFWRHIKGENAKELFFGKSENMLKLEDISESPDSVASRISGRGGA
ncbi:major facilitator superfamily domain-containing protein [Rhypophila decipiens]|uniref:Major facilitator superfamily domain-containing protein n=1 Tax=Rhypophila decipiens TaxID=261697 RepID=A0AAN7B344_9PEZI|nr:major facilitator superfamily domain-containing protein [Rhypophila decipiens]